MASILKDKEKFEKIVKSCLLEINSLKLELTKAQNENNFLKDEKNIGVLKDVIKNRDDEIFKLKNLLNESNRIISDKQTIINEKNSKIQELKDFQSSFNEIKDKLREDINEFKSKELNKNNLDLKETLITILEKDKLINEHLNEIEDYRHKISKLEDNSYYEKFLDIQKEIESKNKMIEELKSNIDNEDINESLKNELNSKNVEINSLLSKINENKETINQYMNEIERDRETINKYEIELNDYKSKMKEYDSKIYDYQSNLNNNKELNSKIKELHAFINMKNIELGEIKDVNNSHENKINSLKEEVESSNNISLQKDKEVINLEKKIAINENKLEFFEKEVESLKNTLFKKEITIKTLEDDLHLKEKKFNDLFKELNERNTKIQRLEQLKTLLKEFDINYKEDINFGSNVKSDNSIDLE